MIPLTTNVSTILQNTHVEGFYLVKIGTEKYTTYFRNVTTLTSTNVAIDTYIANSRLISVSPPQLTSNVDRENYALVFADPEFALANQPLNGINGTDIEVRFCLINPTNNLPLLTINDTILIYKGKADTAGYDVEFSEFGEIQYTVTCSSPMANLEQKKPIMINRSFMKNNVNNRDTSFDFLFEGSGNVVLVWGKS